MAKNTQHILDEANRRQKSAANYANMKFNIALERIPQSEDLLPHIARKELRPKEELSADRIIQNLEDNQRRLEQELRRERLPEEKIQRKYYPFDFGQPDDGSRRRLQLSSKEETPTSNRNTATNRNNRSTGRNQTTNV